MSGGGPPDPGSLPTARWEVVDAVSDRFEAAWRAGQGPRIEDYLGEAPEPDRPVLLCELLAIEVELRLKRGESPTPQEYHSRFPGQADLIAAAFNATVTRGGIPPPMSAAEGAARPPSGTRSI